MKLFLGGDLMVGRGIDQVLPHPVSPELVEPWIHDAREYVRLAEGRSGPLPRPVDPAYPWGDALALLDREAPDARIVNLETSITSRGRPDASKEVHYRLSPANVAVLGQARLDVCALANNHVLDWGPDGLADTLSALHEAGISGTGAGEDEEHAYAPVVLDRGGRRVIVLSVAAGSSGVPAHWTATARGPGVARLPDLSRKTAEAVAARAAAVRRPGDVVVVSIHWGGNWGWDVPGAEVAFAHRLVDAGVDVVHGHSSHHPLPVEIYRDRLVIYGCGELIDDYEGIGGLEDYRPDLVALWMADLAEDGRLDRIRLLPMHLRRFRLECPSEDDTAWLGSTLARLCRRFELNVEVEGGALTVH